MQGTTEALKSMALPSIQELTLTAYHIKSLPPMSLTCALGNRSWMDATDRHFANRCLPMLIANQAGWFILNSHELRVTWNGNNDIASLNIEYLKGSEPYPAVSHFGHGILTWKIPYLFRTPLGINLLVRGPANWPKDGVCPLEGLVETDWSPATFTMNWKLTHVDLPVLFALNEPICMIVPQRRGDLENVRPLIRDLQAEPEIDHGYQRWSESRQQFLKDLERPESAAVQRGWQKDYFRGFSSDGLGVAEHQTKLRLRSFTRPE